MVKHLPIMWETRVQSLGQEDLLEKEMATHSTILAWKIPWTEEPSRLQCMGLQRVGHDSDFTYSLVGFTNSFFYYYFFFFFLRKQGCEAGLCHSLCGEVYIGREGLPSCH